MEKIKTPTRMVIIGASHTGKSEIVKYEILRNSFGMKKDLEIFIYAPTTDTLNQPAWRVLKFLGYKIVFTKLDKNTVKPPQRNIKIPRLVIFDDLDNGIKTPSWVSEKFTTASHHMNESVICISHKLKIGVTEIRCCTDWIILTWSPNFILQTTCKELGLNFNRVKEMLSKAEGIVSDNDVDYPSHKCYNSVIVKQQFYDEDSCLYRRSKIINLFNYYLDK